MMDTCLGQHLLKSALKKLRVAPCGRPYGPEGKCVSADRIRETIDAFIQTGDSTELASFADVVTVVNHTLVEGDDLIPSIEAIDQMNEQILANIAFVSRNATSAEPRAEAQRMLVFAAHRTPWHNSVGQYIGMMPKTPRGRPFGMNGAAYKPHEMHALWTAYLADPKGAAAAFADCATVQVMLYPDWTGTKIAHKLESGRLDLMTAQVGNVANVAYAIDHVESTIIAGILRKHLCARVKKARISKRAARPAPAGARDEQPVEKAPADPPADPPADRLASEEVD